MKPLPQPGTPRRLAPCAHFCECAGCALQDIEYAAQLELKSQYLTKLFEHLFPEPVTVVPSPAEFRYRNKAELAWIGGSLGYRKRGNPRETFQVRDCLLLTEGWQAVIACIAETFASARDSLGRPMFRYAIPRTGIRSGQRMVGLTSWSADAGVAAEALAARLLADHGVASVVWAVNAHVGDSAGGDVAKLWGAPFITDRLLDCEYEIGLHTFFQPNPACAELALAEILSHVTPGMRVLDACCGVGTIGILAAKRGAKVTGYEIAPAMIEAAGRNADRNGVAADMHFRAGRIRALLKFHNGPVDLAVVDPPRCGLCAKACERLAGLAPAKILYLGCGPDNQARDVSLLCERGYRVTSVKGYDFFPQTPHVECLVQLIDERLGVHQ